MSVIIIPRRHLRQPQGRVAFHPAWEDMVGAVWLPSERRFFGPSFGAFPTIGAGGGVVVVPGSGGLMSRAENGTPIYVQSNEEFWRTDFTLIAVFEGGVNATFFGARIGSGFKFGANPSGVTFTEFGVADRNASFPVTAGETHVISVNAKASSPGNHVADGKVVSSFTSGAFSTPAGNVGIFGWIDGGGTYYRDPVLTRGVYSLTVLKRNDLGAALALHDAPYQIFRADPLRIYSLPSGPVSPTITGITASLVTSGSARITLEVTR